MGIRDLLTRPGSKEVFECRDCGSQVSADVSDCPVCGSSEIAHYTFDE